MEVLSLSFSVGAPTYNERAGANMRKIMKRYAERDRKATKQVCEELSTTTITKRKRKKRRKKKKKSLPILLQNDSITSISLDDVPETTNNNVKRTKRKKKKKRNLNSSSLDDIDLMKIKISETPEPSNDPTFSHISKRKRAQTSRIAVRSRGEEKRREERRRKSPSPYDDQPFRQRFISRASSQRKSAPASFVRLISSRRSTYKHVDVVESRRKAEERVAASRREEKRKINEILNRKPKYNSDFVENSRLLAQERVNSSRRVEVAYIDTSPKKKRGSNVDLDEVLRRTKQRLKKREEAARKEKEQKEEMRQQNRRYENFNSEEMIRMAQERVRKHKEKVSPKKMECYDCDNSLHNLISGRVRLKAERLGQKELREQRRAEIYAMNMIMSAWNQRKMRNFDAEMKKKKNEESDMKNKEEEEDVKTKEVKDVQ